MRYHCDAVASSEGKLQKPKEYDYDTAAVVQIEGYFEHSNACQLASMERPPQLPILPEIREEVAAMLRMNMPVAEILAQNLDMIQKVQIVQ